MKTRQLIFWFFVFVSAVGLMAFPIEAKATLAILPLLIGGLASLGSGIAGHLANMSAQERAQMLQEKGVQEWLKLNIPDPEKQKLALDRFVQVGELSPEMETAFKVAESEMAQIEANPQARGSRQRALQALEEMGYGGERMEDQAARQQAGIESGARSRGQQEAIISDFARRGELGSGLELSARMDAAQAEGDRLASTGLNQESERRKRAFDAIMGAGDLAGAIEDDDYRMDSDAALAKDKINLFNTQNMQAVHGGNVDRRNEAAAYNLGTKQDVSDKNVVASNFEQQYNKELAQKDFENQAMKAAGVSGQYDKQAATERAQGQSAADMWGGLATNAGKIGLGAYQATKKKTDEDEE